jgi:AraC family ethanolamine operon transcriptional activator
MAFETDHIKNRTAPLENPIRFRAFDDHEEFSSALSGWIPIMRKLDRGPFAGSLLQIDFGEVRVVRVRIDSLLEVEGVAPQGFQSFGIPAGERTLGNWCGRSVSGGRFVNSFDESGSFEAVIRPGFESFVVSVQKDFLYARRASMEISAEDVCPGARVTEHGRSSLETLLGSLRMASDSLLTDPVANSQEALREQLRLELPGRLLELRSAGKHAPVTSPRLRDRVLRKAREWIEAAPAEGLTVANLCRGIGAGERTVRRAFLEYYGVAPRDYLKAQRLNGVHSELLESDPAYGLVSDVANRWGFWHLGQLAADYRQLFDELPSKTLLRAR